MIRPRRLGREERTGEMAVNATRSPVIPYEKQADPQTNRMCGAASLSMVYRSLGKAVPQAEIWPRVAKYNRLNSLAAATHLIVQDALNEGYAALAIQAKHPLQMLRLCLDQGIRAILNHRLREDGSTGHYTVLVDVDADHVVLHDPYLGPARRVPHGELLELWRPRYLNAEIAGNVLIGITAQPAALPPCTLCGTAIPPSIDCPGCGKAVPLQPAAMLGCMGAGCPSRLWNYLCCPSCDHTWSFSLPGAQVPAAAEEDPWKLGRLFEELDKFCASVFSSPEVAGDPVVRQQLEFIRSSKDKLKLAQSESLGRRRMLQAQLAQLQQKSKEDKEAILRKREEVTQPAPPLDGSELGLALLRDLQLLEGPAQPVKGTAPPPQAEAPARRPGSSNGAAVGDAARNQSVAPQPSKETQPEPPPPRGDRGEFDSWIP